MAVAKYVFDAKSMLGTSISHTHTLKHLRTQIHAQPRNSIQSEGHFHRHLYIDTINMTQFQN